MKRFHKLLGFILIGFALVFTGCYSEDTGANSDKVEEKQEVKIPSFEEYVRMIRGSSFIQKSELKDGVVTIRYYGSYDEYKKENPDSKIDSKDFNTYWSGTQGTQKRLEMNLTRGFTESLRIARLYPEVKKIDMEIPVKGKVYKFKASREELEQFFKANFDELHKAYQEGNKSLSEYIDPVIHKESKRKEFLDTFVTQ
ncbi:hypothetical protein [Melghirimyces algeriensis]|uniref:DUF4825 domain-containing protein n=1 Tax=Melghirimyces algeriensis TaxID=910412 RepID=A0A521C925_9BACL|nr:hypothetical protein [Melghirimyces algeriensis]SMO55230.1 hypothetical protein SAMN06264849_103167 [Melghirimyces algeriensis]